MLFPYTFFFYKQWTFTECYRKITLKIIHLSIHTPPENLSTSALLAQIHNWKHHTGDLATSLQHCLNAFTHKIFLLNHLHLRKFAETVWWVILKMYTDKTISQNTGMGLDMSIVMQFNCFTALLPVFSNSDSAAFGFPQTIPLKVIRQSDLCRSRRVQISLLQSC